VIHSPLGGEAVVAEQVTQVRLEPCPVYADGVEESLAAVGTAVGWKKTTWSRGGARP
jgi:hypothetical protein